MFKKEYYYGLDQLRAILMLIGVLLHTAALVNDYYQWNYVSKHYQNGMLHDIVYISHFFRMETFFMIAGFFSAMVLVKKGTRYFMDGRIRRVLIPLISSIVLINTFEVWFSVSHGIKAWSEIGLSDFIVHSWFLLTLMLLSCLCLLPVDKFLDWFGSRKIWMQAGMLLFYIFVPYGIRFVLTRFVVPADDAPLLYSLLGYFVERTLHYSVYFFLGYQLYRSERLKSILRNSKIYCLIALIAAAGLLYQYSLIGELETQQRSIANYAGMLVVVHVTALATAWTLFGFFFKASFKPSASSAFLVKSAIIVYLFHHPLVIVFGYYLDMPGLGSGGYFLLVAACVYLYAFFIYYLINSNALTRWLFGLK